MAALEIAISPCPNDTFAFYSLRNEYKIGFLDIEELNRALIQGVYPIAKGSFAILDKISAVYEILPVGAAIGRGVGPVLVGELKPGGCVALPGENTTAHRLFRFWEKKHPAAEPCRVVQMPFFEMLPALKTGEVDAAVLIHEGRFVYAKAGLELICDLGAFWENEAHALVPLGCIYAKRSLPAADKDAFTDKLRRSIQVSQNAYRTKSAFYAEGILPYMKQLAQEKDTAVVEAHVDTYVTSDTETLSAAALKSIDVFTQNCLTKP